MKRLLKFLSLALLFLACDNTSVPRADYDGLVLAIDKDITDERDYHLTENGEYISSSDLYADILTRSDGTKQSADDFYFIRVSDLLEYFQDKH